MHDGGLVLGTDLLIPHVSDALMDAVNGMDKPELTCISEEGIADMDLPDNILDEFEYAGDCITSCNKVENILLLIFMSFYLIMFIFAGRKPSCIK